MSHPPGPGWDHRSRVRTLAIALGVALGSGFAGPAVAGTDWLPPKPVSVVAPNVTLALGQPRTVEFLVRANGVPAALRWTATPSGQFVPMLGTTTGTISLAADQTVTVPLTITVPATAPSPSSGFVTIKLTYDPSGGQACSSVSMMIRAATGGRPEFYPVPSTLQTAAGQPATLVYQLKSTISTAEQFTIQVTQRLNPDENNTSYLVPYTPPTSSVNLPGLGTLDVPVPIYMPASMFPGNLNTFAVTATNIDLSKLSDARGSAFAVSADPDSAPSGFFARGTVPQEQTATTRDGPVPVPGRDLWLVPSGNFGVRVVKDTVLDQVGKIDLDNDGLDDRLDGRIRPPTFSASIAVVPGYVNTTTLDVLDLGLLAAGRGGLMLVDLRDIIDPVVGDWSDFYDLDGDGIDDRILRRLPVGGFATDVEWFRSPEGRVIAVVATADTGSVPTAIGYNPALTTPGTGAGIVAIDVQAALDSLPGVPYLAGSRPTPGNVLDLELRGGPNPDLAAAAGVGGVDAYSLSAAGAPAAVTFTPLGHVTLDATWGAPVARDMAWISNAGDSLYLSVAAGAAGMQVIRVPHGSAPMLVLSQRVEAPAIGVASSAFGYIAAALGATGATLLRMPVTPELDQIDPLAAPPYSAPVVLGMGATWTEGRALRQGLFGAFSSSTTALRFRDYLGGATAPDLLCVDGTRTLMIRSALAGVLDVPITGHRSETPGVRVTVAPNPARGHVEFRVLADWALAGELAPHQPVEFSILDVQGRVTRRWSVGEPGAGVNGLLARGAWDGRDPSGRPAAAGRYWVRASQRGGWSARAGFLLLR